MGTKWSQDDQGSQSQPNLFCGEPQNPRETKNYSSSYNIGNDVVKAEDIVQDSESEARHRGINIGKKSNDQILEKKAKAIHNLDAILANADSPLDRLSPENFETQLRNGIFLNQKRQKYWVDKKSKNCFMIYARDLSITWGEDDRYWIWHPANDASEDESIEVAELRDVCWLEVCGKFDTKNLTPNTTYEVSIVAMVKKEAYGWVSPVSLVLNLPDGSKIERKVDVMLVQPREQWAEISTGMFRTSLGNQLPARDITFSLFECGKWKRGLVIKGVKIHPA